MYNRKNRENVNWIAIYFPIIQIILFINIIYENPNVTSL